MAEVVVFHHAQGLTSGIVAFADELRAAGHTVHSARSLRRPHLRQYRRGDGIRGATELSRRDLKRGTAAVEAISPAVVYAGFSLGVLPAQMLAQTRTGARGALLFYSCIPAAEFGGWPADLPVQVHGMDADPIFVGEGDVDNAREIVSQAQDGELFLYPGDQHYFSDSSLPSYDPEATRLLTQRVLEFLADK